MNVTWVHRNEMRGHNHFSSSDGFLQILQAACSLNSLALDDAPDPLLAGKAHTLDNKLHLTKRPSWVQAKRTAVNPVAGLWGVGVVGALAPLWVLTPLANPLPGPMPLWGPTLVGRLNGLWGL